MNKRVVAIVAALVLAASGTFVLINYVQGAEDRALEGEETVTVLVVDKLIEAGTPASELSGSVREERVPAKVQAAGSVGGLDALADTVATVDLLPGEQIISTRFQPVEVFEELQDEGDRDFDIPAGYLEATVEIDAERALAGEVQPGDTVAVVASFDPFRFETIQAEDGSGPIALLFPTASEDGDDPTAELFGTSSSNTTHIILHKVLVTDVHEEKRPTNANNGATLEEAGHKAGPEGTMFVTLALTAPDIEKLVFTQEHGFVWLAKEPLSASEAGTVIQTRGTIYE